MDQRLGELPVQGLLDSVGARTTAPGGGAVAGVVAALAGALTGMCARFSAGDQVDLARRADDLGAMAVDLAQADLAVYAAYARARRSAREDVVAAALDEAVRIPLEMARVAAELAELAAGLARSGNPNLRGDATAAVLMGAAAARAGAVLVCENLAGSSGDPRLVRAAAIVASASAAERSALSRYPALTAR